MNDYELIGGRHNAAQFMSSRPLIKPPPMVEQAVKAQRVREMPAQALFYIVACGSSIFQFSGPFFIYGISVVDMEP